VNGSRACFTASIPSTPSLAISVCIPDGDLLDRSVHAPWSSRAGALCDSRELDCSLVREKGNLGLDRDGPLRDGPYRASLWIGYDRTDRPGGHQPAPSIMCRMDDDLICTLQKSAGRRPEDARDVVPGFTKADETNVAK
jgi:hypothetical protein